MNDRTLVRLQIISSTHSVEQISADVGMDADLSWNAGDAKNVGKGTHLNNGWQITSGIGEAESLSDHIDALCSRTRSHAIAISRLPTEVDVIVSCVIYSDYNPELFLNIEQIQQIAALRASLDLDVYAVED